MTESTQSQRFKIGRIVLAFLLAPMLTLAALLIVLLLYSVIGSAGRMTETTMLFIVYLYALAIAYAHALILALPTFLVMKKLRKNISKQNCLLAGFFIGALPYLIFMGIIASTDPHGHGNIPMIMAIAVAFGLIGTFISYLFWRIGIKPHPTE